MKTHGKGWLTAALTGVWLLGGGWADCEAGSAAGLGDFAPLQTGNSWKYVGKHYIHTDDEKEFTLDSLTRTLRVESRQQSGDGVSYTIQVHDSLYRRSLLRRLGDTVRPPD